MRPFGVTSGCRERKVQCNGTVRLAGRRQNGILQNRYGGANALS